MGKLTTHENEPLLAEKADQSVAIAFQRRALLALICFTLILLIGSMLSIDEAIKVTSKSPETGMPPHIASQDNVLTLVFKLWNNQCYFTVFIIAICSCVLPIMKLCAVGLAEILQLHNVRTGYFTRLGLSFLDFLGRWSFAEAILMCFCCILLHVHTRRVHLAMQVQSAMVCLVFGLLLSQTITYWRRSMQHQLAEPRMNAPVGQSLQPIATRAGMCAIASFTSFVMVVFGASFPLIIATRTGALAQEMQKQEEELGLSISVLSYELAHLGWRTGQPYATGFLTFVFATLTFVVPMMELLALGMLGIFALVPERELAPTVLMQSLFNGADFLCSFNCLDVVLGVSLVLDSELKEATIFHIGSECVRVMGNPSAGVDACFATSVKLGTGWYVLALALVVRLVAWSLGATIRKQVQALQGCSHANTGDYAHAA